MSSEDDAGINVCEIKPRFTCSRCGNQYICPIMEGSDRNLSWMTILFIPAILIVLMFIGVAWLILLPFGFLYYLYGIVSGRKESSEKCGWQCYCPDCQPLIDEEESQKWHREIEKSILEEKTRIEYPIPPDAGQEYFALHYPKK